MGWIFGRIKLDPKIQITYVDTKNRLADMLTKGHFTRDELNHFLPLLKIMNFSMFSCSHFFRTESKEGSAVARPRPMNLVSRNLCGTKKSLPQDSSVSNSPENQELDQSYVSPGIRKLMRNSNQDPTTYSQERRQDDTLYLRAPGH